MTQATPITLDRRMIFEISPPPFRVATLAERWGCSASMIRKLIGQGAITPFKIGTQLRISAAEVERFESCQIIQSSGSGGDLPLSGMSAESAAADSSPPQIGRAPRRKRADFGTEPINRHGLSLVS